MNFFTQKPVIYSEEAVKKFLTPEAIILLKKFLQHISDGSEFSEKDLQDSINSFLQTEDIPLKSIAQPLRVALTGKTVSPGIYEVMCVLGKEETCARINQILDRPVDNEFS